MKYLRLLLGIIVGLILVTVIVESIEVSIVMMRSGLSLNELKDDQDVYFAARNAPLILAAKLVYTFIAALVSGWLAALVAGQFARIAILTLIAIQTAAIIWGGFLSEWASTAPVWLWLLLIPVIAGGFYIGGNFRRNSS